LIFQFHDPSHYPPRFPSRIDCDGAALSSQVQRWTARRTMRAIRSLRDSWFRGHGRVEWAEAFMFWSLLLGWMLIILAR
jgi:hypothetical protein